MAPPRWKVWASRTGLERIESLSSSVVLHAGVILLLAMWTLAPQQKPPPPRIVSSILRPVDDMTQRLDAQTVAAETLALVPSVGIAAITHADAMAGATSQPTLDRAATESNELAGLSVSLADVGLRTLPGERLTEDLGIGSPGDPLAAVGGPEAALDKISQELVLLLSKGKVQLVWLFDQSDSVKSLRDDIKNRVYRIYQELGLTTKEHGDALQTVVASFGQQMTIHSRRPTSDLDVIRQEIDQVPSDPSGLENVCQAVIEAVARTRKTAAAGRRQTVIILVTDESGDDVEQIEAAIAAAQSAQCRLYVMGVEAAFGNRIVYRNWVDPETKLNFWLETRLGPETGSDQQLQTDGLWTRRDCQSSGFGPFELVRMCRETGGVYYILKEGFDANTVGAMFAKYDNEAMRPYLPELAPQARLAEVRNKDPLKQLIGSVVDALNPRLNPQLNLRDRFPLDLNRLAEAAGPQLQKVPVLIAAYDEAQRRLEAMRRLRDQEPSLRWQANYDLMLAQVLTFKVRAYEYAAAMEAFLANPRPVTKPDTTYWLMVGRNETLTAAVTQSTIDRAKQLLEEIKANHPGTPYALRAQHELNRGFGVYLAEDNWDPRHETLGNMVQRPNL